LLLALPLSAQRAQLPRKGRQFEAGRPPALQPIRKLPRRTTVIITTTVTSAAPAPEPVPAGPMSEDRLRPLIRGSITPLSAETTMSVRILPRPQPAETLAPQPTLAGVEPSEVVNRWFIFPSPPWRRYADGKLDAVYTVSHLWDPFNRSSIKGDFPIHGRKEFFSFTGSSETLSEIRRIPVPAVASSASPDSYGVFGRGGQFSVEQNFRLSFDLFRGSAGFQPVSWELRITPEFNINYALTRENALVNSDVLQGIRRTDSNIGMQELFFEKRLVSEKAHFDFSSLRIGIQRFTSDFRGFIYSDEQPGARLFGTFHNNVFQYNLAYFNLLEKDTNSGLNRWRLRQQSVSAANLYWSDFLTKGYTLNFSALYNFDEASFLVDKNGFLVRPAPIGFPTLHGHMIKAGYAGIAGDGHIKRINISHAFYQAFGRDENNPIVNRPLHINAQLAALELSYEKDWMTWRVSGFYTSGDHNLRDRQANGFDAIVPNQQFAGGGFLGNPSLADRGLINNVFAAGGVNFLNREPIPLTGTGVFLFGPNSLIPNMRPGLFEGQANFVNPGITLFNGGFDAKITPKLRSTLNVNWAKLNRTEVLEAVLFQNRIRHTIGLDSGVGVQYRPLLSENIVVTAGFGALAPGQGFKDIYTGRTLFSAFVNLRMVF
jgi:hypothetical protein